MTFKILDSYKKKTALEMLLEKASIMQGAIKHNDKWFLFLNSNYQGAGTQAIDSNGILLWHTYRPRYSNLIRDNQLNDTEIHLFYRNDKAFKNFTYFGTLETLKYLDYNETQIGFLSQIKDWELIKTQLSTLLEREIFIASPHNDFTLEDQKNKINPE
jgi:hypothetical protein